MMIRKNLFLLEYMVKKRIEKDNKRLEAIKSIDSLLEKTRRNTETLVETKTGLIKNLISFKGKPLNCSETELVEEIIGVNNKQ